MAIKFEVHPNAGHPWDNRPGFDRMEFECDTLYEVSLFVDMAEGKFWRAWIVGTTPTGKQGGLFYKPTGATTLWEDAPDKPRPGNIPSSTELATATN